MNDRKTAPGQEGGIRVPMRYMYAFPPYSVWLEFWLSFPDSQLPETISAETELFPWTLFAEMNHIFVNAFPQAGSYSLGP